MKIKIKCRSTKNVDLGQIAALQPADSTYPPGYTGADGRAYQTPKFVVII